MEKIKIHFLGASGTVTGSKFLIESSQKKIMIDCGLFQGLKELREENWKNFPEDPSTIDFILLTHAHLDHSGYIPRLVKQGFKGQILGTAPSLEIAEIILRDSAKIQEEDAERANKEGYSKHDPALPLYNIKKAEDSLKLFREVPLDEWISLGDSIRCKYNYNGHILGATFIELELNGKMFVFSGDIGREKDLLLYPPKKPSRADYLFMESTYGDRLHPQESVSEKLSSLIKETIEKKGSLIIPSFAVERLQTLMFLLWKLFKEKRIPPIPVYIDSPMGSDVLKVFQHFPEWHKLSISDFKQMESHMHIVSSYKETWEVIDRNEAKVVIAGSGMVTGGRVLTYLKQLIDDPKTTVLLAGFQAEGTRGRRLLEGSSEIKLYGKFYTVKAKIHHIDSLSAHADQEGLLNWLSEIKNSPKKVFLIHGEASAQNVLKQKLEEKYSWEVYIPKLYERVEV